MLLLLFQFVQKGEKGKEVAQSRSFTQAAKDWQLQIHVGGRLVVPQEIVTVT